MLKVRSPFDQSVIEEIPFDSKQEIEIKFKTAHDLFSDQSKWIPAHERIAILEKVVSIMKSKKIELAMLATQEGGKPIVDSEVEVARAINGVKIAAENIGHLKGEQIPMGLTKASKNRIAFTTREPIGLIFSISAFNHPLNLIVHQAITAIAAGCPVIIKPALTTPLSCLKLIEILMEAGLPIGWCQSVICEDLTAELFVSDNRINYFSFIGSEKIGWYLRSKLSPGTRCALEHGGSAPVIVEKDAVIDDLIPALLKGGFYHAGQVCVSVQRVFIEESIVEMVSEKLSLLASQLVVGDPMNKTTEVGPLILSKEVDRIEEWVEEAIQSGGTLLCGGKRMSDSCFEPTVILNPSFTALVSTKEVFGPVVCIYSYSDRKEAIKRANSLASHFQAAVFTKNLDVALDTVKQLNATAVMVNDHTAFRVDWMPFGGRDNSGIGMGGIPYSMKEMTREKLMVIKSGVL